MKIKNNDACVRIMMIDEREGFMIIVVGKALFSQIVDTAIEARERASIIIFSPSSRSWSFFLLVNVFLRETIIMLITERNDRARKDTITTNFTYVCGHTKNIFSQWVGDHLRTIQ